MHAKSKKDLKGKKPPFMLAFDSATIAPTPEQCAAAREAKRMKQNPITQHELKLVSIPVPLPIMTLKDVAPGAAATPADKAWVAAIAAAKATAALATMANMRTVDKRAEDVGAASNLLPEPPRTVRATGSPESPGDTELMLVDEAVAVTDTSTATYLCEFSRELARGGAGVHLSLLAKGDRVRRITARAS